eukprot:8695145-Pyramimonas_sp.AAC.1
MAADSSQPASERYRSRQRPFRVLATERITPSIWQHAVQSMSWMCSFTLIAAARLERSDARSLRRARAARAVTFGREFFFHAFDGISPAAAKVKAHTSWADVEVGRTTTFAKL